MVYENCKIYGPYTRKDKRRHIVVVKPDKTKTTVSYPKYLKEVELGRYFLPNETVDHIDRDFTNNELSNLQILGRSNHASLDAKVRVAQDFICPVCNKRFTLEGKRLHYATTNRKRNEGMAGPFCGRSCAGKYGKRVQKGGDRLDVKQVPVEYTYKTKPL